MVFKTLGNYFDKLNTTNFKGQGMEWYLVPGHYWLELRIKIGRNTFTATEYNYTNGQNLDTISNRIYTHGSKIAGMREELKE